MSDDRNAESRRSGFVTLVGRPNSGKSTLLNQLVGEKISIVTDKPQTTRNLIRGIVTRPEGQIVFVDTPGVHKPTHRMNSLMMKSVRDAMNEVDVLALIIDASQPFGKGDRYALDLIAEVAAAKVLILNKIDKVKKPDLLPIMDMYSRLSKFEDIVPLSALRGENVETLLKVLFRLLPTGPALYPDDQLSDQQERSIAAEMVREKLIKLTEDELPYSTAVTIDRFEEAETLVRIFVTIHVERETQKGIVIGKGGRLLKEAGIAARQDLEKLLGRQVYLELRVKVRADWRDDENALRDFGVGE
jgi:GTP-binding protein Era